MTERRTGPMTAALLDGYAYSGATRKRLIEAGLAEAGEMHSSRPGIYYAHRYHFVLTPEGEAIRDELVARKEPTQ